MTSNHICIVGGGVAGLGPAWQLAKRGWDVELYERNRIGSGASTSAAGMLAPTSEVAFEERELLRLGRRSLEMYPQWVDELTEASGVNLGYRTEGTLLVAVDRDDAEALDRLYDYHRRLELPVERLDKDEARELEPGLSPNIHFALFTPSDHQIDPANMVAALKTAFLDAGGTLRENSPVAEIRIDDGKTRGLWLADGSAVDAARVVIAAGAWTTLIDGLEGLLPRIRPVRGQMIAVELGDPPLLERVVRAPDAYLVPKSDGRLLIGSTMEERGFDPRHTAGGMLDVLQGAFEAVPGIYDAHIVDTWTDFRPMTLANKPVIGPTDIEGLHLSVGHGRNGILLTPATAYGLAELVDEGSIPKYLLDFAPDAESGP